MKGLFSKLLISYVDFVYNGDSTVTERNCEDFLKTLWKYKIFKVKSTGKIKLKISCSFYNQGFFKAGSWLNV